MKTYNPILFAFYGTTLALEAISTPLPHSPGMVSNCLDFTPVAKGDTCWGIAQRSGITVEQFIALNPALGSAEQCAFTLLWGQWYCTRAGAAPKPTKPADAPRKTDQPKKTEAPKKTDSPPPTKTPPPKGTPLLKDTNVCKTANVCRGAFVKVPPPKIASQSQWCAGYLATTNTAAPADIKDVPVLVGMECPNSAEVSTYCACWQGGFIHGG